MIPKPDNYILAKILVFKINFHENISIGMTDPNILFDNNHDFSAIIFDDGNYISIEFAGILKSSKNITLAKKFLRFILTEDFQSIIPSSNIMYPVTKIKNLPEAFKELEIPKAIQLDPATISENKKEWIEEWLNAY